MTPEEERKQERKQDWADFWALVRRSEALKLIGAAVLFLIILLIAFGILPD